MSARVATHAKKEPFFFRAINFDYIRSRGNTHYCFACGGHVGFTPGPRGVATNTVDSRGCDTMPLHDHKRHAHAILGNIDKYPTTREWIDAETNADFPYLIFLR
jgi:hypothetical protein